MACGLVVPEIWAIYDILDFAVFYFSSLACGFVYLLDADLIDFLLGFFILFDSIYLFPYLVLVVLIFG